MLRRARNIAKARRFLLPDARAENAYREGISGILDQFDDEGLDEDDLPAAEQRTRSLFWVLFLALAANNRGAARRELGTSYFSEAGLTALMYSAMEENVALVKAALEAYRAGASRAATVARLDVIAVDQVQKTNEGINTVRQKAAGCTTYFWLTMRDDRVRPTHARNDGKVFSYDVEPPVTGHPGHDVNCRCVAVGILPVLT